VPLIGSLHLVARLARSFYGGTLGLEVLLEDEQFLTCSCGGGSRLVVTKSTTGTADDATKASWRVTNIASEVTELRARGVEIQDLPQLGTVGGIADLGFALAAWFTDPAPELDRPPAIQVGKAAHATSVRMRWCLARQFLRESVPRRF
jgi:catechol-2,3-dioxygenase